MIKLWLFFILPISLILFFNYLNHSPNSYNFLSNEPILPFLKTVEVYAFKSTVESVEILLEKADTLFDSEKYDEAIEMYDKVLAIDPDDVDALNGKAFALANLDKNEEALPVIEKALQSNSDDEYYLSTAAFIMYNLDKDDEAKNYYNKALEIDPNLKDILSEEELDAFNSVME